MPPQKAPSKLMQKLGDRARRHVLENADKEAEFGRIDLPPGVKGYAQLKSIEFAEYKTGDNKGKYYMRAVGVVVEPEYFRDQNGVETKVGGQQTSIMVPVEETSTKSFEENIERAENELKKLGLSAEDIRSYNGDIEEMAAALVSAAPYFKFSTSPRKNMQTGQVDGIWENWNGTDPNYTPPDAQEGAVNEAPASPPPPPKAAPKTPPAAAPKTQTTKPGTKATAPKAAPTPPTPPPVEYRDDEDVDSLIERANGDDTEAQEKLSEMAVAKGYSEEDVSGAPSWQVIGDWIKGEDGEASSEEPAADESPIPAVGETYYYTPPKDPKNPKAAVKKHEVDVTAVNEAKQTADLKSLDDPKKSWKAVPWADFLGGK